ncbi:MAG: hypothetical protein DI547_04960 [Sphingobium sp.]|nr:MAG: hypothetical protein DI547_04960 [Sphingobium sp.]
MSKAPDIAPALPAGCVDFNKLHDALIKGDEKAVEKAVVIPEAERPAPEPKAAPAPSPAPAPRAAE